MKQVRRQIRRYKAGRCLREALRDLLISETEQMRADMRQFTRQLQEMARPSSKPGAVAREFERELLDTVRSARAIRFDDAWRSFQRAMAALKTTEETWMAHQTIEQLRDRLAGLSEQFKGAEFATIQDFQIFLSRAINFYDQEKYRTARFIAAESLGSLARLTTAAPEAEKPPAELLRRIAEMDALADTLEAWNLGGGDAAEIREAAAAIRGTVLLRQFEFARLLAGDLEADRSPVSTFVNLVQTRAEIDEPSEVVRQLLGAPDDGHRPDWASATGRLLDRSLARISERLGGQVAAPGGNGS